MIHFFLYNYVICFTTLELLVLFAALSGAAFGAYKLTPKQ